MNSNEIKTEYEILEPEESIDESFETVKPNKRRYSEEINEIFKEYFQKNIIKNIPNEDAMILAQKTKLSITQIKKKIYRMYTNYLKGQNQDNQVEEEKKVEEVETPKEQVGVKKIAVESHDMIEISDDENDEENVIIENDEENGIIENESSDSDNEIMTINQRIENCTKIFQNTPKKWFSIKEVVISFKSLTNVEQTEEDLRKILKLLVLDNIIIEKEEKWILK